MKKDKKTIICKLRIDENTDMQLSELEEYTGSPRSVILRSLIRKSLHDMVDSSGVFVWLK